MFLTAFGIMILAAMHLVLAPPIGIIQAISRVSSKSIGFAKGIYDSTCVVISVLIGFAGVGFGIATIVSAFLVGRVLMLLQKTIGKSKIFQIS